MRLFVGLGNPGSRYARQPPQYRLHGGGRDRARPQRGARGASASRREAAEAVIGGEKVLLLKPQTYHERVRPGGRRGAALLQDPARTTSTVFYDELDLPPAKLRVKIGGGNAGHNGLRSITAHCGNEYRRVRLGIGHPGHKALVQQPRARRFRQGRGGLGRGPVPGHRRQCRPPRRGEDASFQNKVHLAMEARGWTDVKRPGEKDLSRTSRNAAKE